MVVYSPHIEPLVELADLYSTARRTAYVSMDEDERKVPSEDFPVDPTLLLVPMVQSARARRWQVLPGRTHPLMIGKGGAEGYVFVATRVVPAEGKVSARGRAPRRKRLELKDEMRDEESSREINLDGNNDRAKRIKTEGNIEGILNPLEAVVEMAESKLEQGEPT